MEYQLIEPRIPQTVKLSAVERVLTNRGIALAEIKHFLNTTDDDILPPSSIKNIERGVKMLISHISQEHDIMVQVDSDADGMTSSAALINYLNILFPAFVQNHITYRLHDGKQHGIIPETVADNIKLLIVPDAGSNNYEEHALLAQRGVDILVIDHHEAEFESENACIINNQICDYPTKSLSGVGMVYKFCSYIDELLNVEYANTFLDLVALGMIADMVPLRDFETKHLVMRGLNQIRNPFFQTMVDKQSYQLKDGVTPFGIAFYIAPYVNATIRVGMQEEKLLLFESMLDYRGYELIPSTKRGCKGQTETRVEQACRNCSNIKNRQTKTRDNSLEIIEYLIEKQNLLDHKILMIKSDMDLDRNVTGLIANQLMATYQKPVLLLNKSVKDNEVYWEGSGRGLGNSKFDDFRNFIIESGMAEYAEGHAQAFGASFTDENAVKFLEYADEQLKDFDFSTSYKVDFIFNHNDMNLNEILSLAELKSIYGQGVEEPLIAMEDIKVRTNNVKLMSPDKSPTLKITLPNGLNLLKFRSSAEEYEALSSSPTGCVSINIVGKCERNIWNGIINPQITLEAYEIVGKTEYYF
jgi:single-stranded-DNA-specific exonuclease